MSDYLGPLTIGPDTASTYCLSGWQPAPGGASVGVEVIVSAASADALAVSVERLVAQLGSGSTWVHTWPGSSYPLVYAVLAGSLVALDGKDTWSSHWKRLSFTLTAAGSPAGALVALYAAEQVAAPASLSLATLLGTNPPALDITVDDDSGNDMHSVMCALAPSALTDAMWLVKASDLTWTTMTDATNANAWVSEDVRTTTSASYQTAPLDTARYPQGKYRLYARVAQSAGIGYVKESERDSAVAVSRTSPHLVAVADIELPVRDSAYGTAANLTLSVKSDGTNALTVDAFLLWPLSWGSFSWHHATVTSECDQLDVGPSGVFVDGVCDTTYLKGGVLVPRVLAAHVPTLVATASPTGDTWPGDWYRTSADRETATGGKFQMDVSGQTDYVNYALTAAASPLVVPGAWYELAFEKVITAYTAGSLNVALNWYDVDGNLVRSDDVLGYGAADGSPVDVVAYGKAPVHAARCAVSFYTVNTPTLTAQFSGVVLRRCPLRLLVACEDAAGVCSSNRHAVHLTAKYRPLYEVAR